MGVHFGMELEPWDVAESLRLLADKIEAGELRPTNVSLDWSDCGPSKFNVDVYSVDGLRGINKAFGEVLKPLEPPPPPKKLVECDCSAADKCPQGKAGMQTKCRIWREAA